MDPMLAFALPGGALAFGAVVFALHKLSMWQFNRKHPNLRRGADRGDVAEVSLEAAAAAAAAASSEMLDDAMVEGAVTANQNAPRSPSRHAWTAAKHASAANTIKRLKRSGMIVSADTVLTVGGQARAHSNILPPRPARHGHWGKTTSPTPK